MDVEYAGFTQRFTLPEGTVDGRKCQHVTASRFLTRMLLRNDIDSPHYTCWASVYIKSLQFKHDSELPYLPKLGEGNRPSQSGCLGGSVSRSISLTSHRKTPVSYPHSSPT